MGKLIYSHESWVKAIEVGIQTANETLEAANKVWAAKAFVRAMLTKLIEERASPITLRKLMRRKPHVPEAHGVHLFLFEEVISPDYLEGYADCYGGDSVSRNLRDFGSMQLTDILGVTGIAIPTQRQRDAIGNYSKRYEICNDVSMLSVYHGDLGWEIHQNISYECFLVVSGRPEHYTVALTEKEKRESQTGRISLYGHGGKEINYHSEWATQKLFRDELVRRSKIGKVTLTIHQPGELISVEPGTVHGFLAGVPISRAMLSYRAAMDMKNEVAYIIVCEAQRQQP